MESLIIPFSFCSECEMADDSQKEEQAFSDYPIGLAASSHVQRKCIAIVRNLASFQSRNL